MEQHPLLRLVIKVLGSVFTIQTASVWINGFGPAVTKTHFDSDHNLIFVLHGSCTFYTAARSSFAPDGGREHESTNTPDNSPFFKANHMTAGQCALQPAYMWHYVESSQHCVKIALFFN